MIALADRDTLLTRRQLSDTYSAHRSTAARTRPRIRVRRALHDTLGPTLSKISRHDQAASTNTTAVGGSLRPLARHLAQVACT